nr:hypothetical protein [Pantoea sp. 201603H]
MRYPFFIDTKTVNAEIKMDENKKIKTSVFFFMPDVSAAPIAAPNKE